MRELDELYEKGFSDVLFGGREGRVFADFTRKTTAPGAAILDAIDMLEKAMPRLRIVRVESDSVTPKLIATINSLLAIRDFPKSRISLKDRRRIVKFAQDEVQLLGA